MQKKLKTTGSGQRLNRSPAPWCRCLGTACSAGFSGHRATLSAGGDPGHPAARGRRDLAGEATTGRAQAAPCSAERAAGSPAVISPTQGSYSGNQRGGSARPSWKILEILEVSFDSLFPCSSPQAPSPCPLGSNSRINLTSLPVFAPCHRHVTSSPECNLHTDCSLWGPTCSDPTNLCSLFSDQLSQLPLVCLLPPLSHTLLPGPALAQPGGSALETSRALPSPPSSSLTTSPCECCTARLTISSDLKNVLVPTDEPRPFSGSANTRTSWWCA